MVWAAALALVSADLGWKEDHYVWDNAGSVFSIYPTDIKRDGNRSSVWIRSDHSRDRTVAYRTMVQRIQFNCDGTSNVVALSTYDKVGNQTYSWDGFGALYAIRPNTMQEWAESVSCKK